MGKKLEKRKSTSKIRTTIRAVVAAEFISHGPAKHRQEDAKRTTQQQQQQQQLQQQQQNQEKQQQQHESWIQEPEEEEVIDPNVAYRNSVFEIIKNGFSLAYTEDGELKINVDNVSQLLKVLELNPQNDSVLDMVRTACIESFGDIDPQDFDNVVVALIKEKDEELWAGRMEEKKELAEKRRQKAERDAELPKAPEPEIVNDDDEEEEGGEPKERKMTQEEIRAQKLKEELELEEKEDELYETIRMAFKFIDSDEDGLISVRDIYNLMFGLGEMLMDEELQDMFQAVDLDRDGKISYEDFKHFLCGEPEQPEVQPEADEVTESVPAEEAAPDVVTEQKDETQPEQSSVSEDSSSPGPKSPAPKTPEFSPEEEERRARRKKSLLWGYMTSAANAVAEAEKAKSKTALENVVERALEKTETKESEGDDGEVFVTEQEETEDKPPEEPKGSEEAPLDLEPQETESSGQLGAIKEEEDEHSEYDQHSAMPAAPDKRIDHKRKIFSRQSSSASLKNRQGSTAAASEGTVADSGFGTFDDNSDIREGRDMEEYFTDDETIGESVELEKLSVHASTLRRNSRSSRDETVDDNDVTSSDVPSRAASQLTRENLSAVEDEEMLEKTNKVRTMQFVNEHMYHEIEHEPTESELEHERLTQERLKRAQFLQKAILRRTDSVPLFRKVSVSKKTNKTPPKTNINGMVCSHINIDLTGNSPPKAHIRSHRQPPERTKSARTPRDSRVEQSTLRSMSIITIDTEIGSRKELSKWPRRPLTRPRSAAYRKVVVNTESPPSPRGVTPQLPQETPTPRRKLTRPQTAPMNYQTYRTPSPRVPRMPDLVSVELTEPFANSDSLYPEKSSLTTCHHGFKSIWPIGRQINVLQKKRPFSGFEMNSYSRAIERRELNFRTSRSPSTCYTGDVIPARKLGQHVEVSRRPTSAKIIKLEPELKQLSVRPKIKNTCSSLLPDRPIYPATAR